MVGFAICAWLGLGLVMYPSGMVVEGPDGTGLTMVQTVYLMSQILTTSGYGDLVPKTTPGMLFTTFYVLFCALLVSAATFEILDRVASSHHEHTGSIVGKLVASEDGPSVDTWFSRNRDLMLSASIFIGCIGTWTWFFVNGCDAARVDTESASVYEQQCEVMSLVEAFYFAVSSVTGVGFGDVVARTPSGQLFSSVGSLVGLCSYVNLLEKIAMKLLDMKELSKIEHLSEQDILAADENNDGTLDAFEFTRFMLTRYDLVSPAILDGIKKNFEELDIDKSGTINTDDLALLCERQALRISEHMKSSNN